jgi:transposase
MFILVIQKLEGQAREEPPGGTYNAVRRAPDSGSEEDRADRPDANNLAMRHPNRDRLEREYRSDKSHSPDRTLGMKIDFETTRIFIRPGTTDMRKATNGLSSMAQTALEMDPFSGSIYLFCSRDRRLLKAIYWDRNGFCLWHKRLERDRFPWPDTEEKAQELRAEEVAMLLDGIDFFHAHRALSYGKAC